MSMLTITAVLGLAVVDMLSPALIGVTLYLLLARPRRTGLLLGVYLATVAAAYLLLGVVLMVGLGAVVPVSTRTCGPGSRAGSASGCSSAASSSRRRSPAVGPPDPVPTAHGRW